MGRQRTREEKLALAESARQLREQGRSRREIQELLGIGESLAKSFLRGVPVPDSRRPHTKRAECEAAVAMRANGKTYTEIAAELGVSKGSLSLWLREQVTEGEQPPQPEGDDDRAALRVEARRLRRDGMVLFEIGTELGVSAKTIYYWTWDLPVPASARSGAGGGAAHMDMMRRRYWDRVLAEREEERQRIRAEHHDRVGALTRRELELLAVTAYWCEGTKSKGLRATGAGHLHQQRPRPHPALPLLARPARVPRGAPALLAVDP